MLLRIFYILFHRLRFGCRSLNVLPSEELAVSLFTRVTAAGSSVFLILQRFTPDAITDTTPQDYTGEPSLVR